MLNNKGQIAKTVTWVVATLIVIVTLITFIFISVQVSKATSWKNINIEFQKFFLDEKEKITERLKTKNIFAWSINENNKDKIKEWIENE